MSRSGATIRSRNTSPIAGPRASPKPSTCRRTGRRNARWTRCGSWQSPRAGQPFPIAIVAYADMLAEDIRPQLDALTAEPSVRGVRMQLHWHDNPLYRFAQSPDLARDPRPAAQRRAACGLWLEFRSPGFRRPDGGGGGSRHGLPESDVRSAAFGHAGGPDAGRHRIVARGHEAPRRLPQRRQQIIRPRHIPPAQRSGACRLHCGETLALFGAERCLFGSNFPIEKLWTTYAALIGAHRAGIPATDHDQVFNRTARRVYRLGQ